MLKFSREFLSHIYLRGVRKGKCNFRECRHADRCGYFSALKSSRGRGVGASGYPGKTVLNIETAAAPLCTWDDGIPAIATALSDAKTNGTKHAWHTSTTGITSTTQFSDVKRRSWSSWFLNIFLFQFLIAILRQTNYLFYYINQLKTHALDKTWRKFTTTFMILDFREGQPTRGWSGFFFIRYSEGNQLYF